MRVNHYAVLGLCPDGKANGDQPYTEAQIKKAYKDLAIKLHPDKNAGVLYVQYEKIKCSYEILRNTERRDAFDDELARDPSLVAQEQLLVELRETPHSFQSSSPLSTSTALINMPKPTGIPFTQLLKNTNASPECIFKLARNNFATAKIIFMNVSTFEILPVVAQYEFLFFLFQQARDHPSCLLEKKEQQRIALIFSYLDSTHLRYNDYIHGFIDACIRCPHQAENLFDTQIPGVDKMVLSMPCKEDLLRLSEHFYSAAKALVTRYYDTLRPAEVQHLLKKYFEYGDEIIGIFGSHKQTTQLDLIYVATECVFLGDIQKKAVQIWGVESLFLTDNRCQYINYKYIQAVLTILLTEKSLENFLSTFDERSIFNLLTYLGIYWRVADWHCRSSSEGVREYYLKYFTERSLDFFKNISILESLFKKFEIKEFYSILSSNRVMHRLMSQKDNIEIRNFFVNFFLYGKKDKSEEYFLIECLSDNFVQLCEIFKKNTDLLCAMFDSSVYKEYLIKNDRAVKKMALIAVRCRFSIEDMGLNNCLGSFLTYYPTYNTFYENYLIKNTRKSHSVAAQEVSDICEAVGFFPDLFLLQTQDLNVKCIIFSYAKDHLGDRDSWEPGNFSWCKIWIKNILLEGSPSQRQELLKLLEEWPSYMLEFLNKGPQDLETPPEEEARLSREALWGQVGLAYLGVLADNAYWLEPYLTGHLLNAWLECSDLRKYLAEALCPVEAAAGYHALTTHAAYQNKIAAYQNLDTLCAISRDDDETLRKWISTLKQTGFDFGTFLRLKMLIETIHPILFSGLASYIFYNSDEFRLHTSMPLKNSVEKYAASGKDLLTLSLTFPTIAIIYIRENHKDINGDFLNQLASIHQDAVSETINLYGLEILLQSAAKLSQVVTQITEQAGVFSEVLISAEQTILNLMQEFETLVETAAFSEQKNDIDAFYATLSRTKETCGIIDSQILHLLKTYPQKGQDRLIYWVLGLALEGDNFSKKTLAAWIANPLYGERIMLILLDAAKKEDFLFFEKEDLFWCDIIKKIIKHHLPVNKMLEEDIDEIVSYFSSLVQKKKVTLNTICNLDDAHFEILKKLKNYLETDLCSGGEGFESHLLSLDFEKLILFPLLDQQFVSLQDLKNMSTGSFEYKLFSRVVEDFSVDKINAINLFIHNQYFTFIQTEILVAFDREIARLVLDFGGSCQKSLLLCAEKEKFIDIIVGQLCLLENDHNMQFFQERLHNALVEKIKLMVDMPAMTTQRHPLRAFFKALLGVLLSAPFCFTPLLSSQYRNVFFSCRSVQTFVGLQNRLAEQYIAT